MTPVFQGAQVLFLDPQRNKDGEQVLAEDRRPGQRSIDERIGLWPEVLWGDRWGRGQVETNDDIFSFQI